MKPTERISHRHKQIPRRIKKMAQIAKNLGCFLNVEWYTTPHEWLSCELYLWWRDDGVKKLPLWQMERYLEVCDKFKAFL